MADAKKCDRCGSFYEWYEKEISIIEPKKLRPINGVSFIRFGPINNCVASKFEYDLCPLCLDSLIDFMNIPNRYDGLSDEEYYWEKAEFQDEVSHRRHVENYKMGFRDSIVFDEEYAREAGICQTTTSET